MLQTPVKAFLITILVLVAIGFILAAVRSPDGQESQVSNSRVNEPMVLGHKYFAGANTYSGSFMTPTPCYEWDETDVELTETIPEEITLIISAEETEDAACEQIPAKKDFIFLVPSSPEAFLTGVELNGEQISFEIRKD